MEMFRCGHINFITENKSSIEIFTNTLDFVGCTTFKVVNKDLLNKLKNNNDIKVGLFVAISYNENFEVIKISYLKGGL